jgi:epoxyqueuosine reductase QueG
VITNAPLKVTPRKSDEPYANCLNYAKGTCRECAKNCPASAITEKGYDKTKCNKYRNKVAREMVPRLKPILKAYNRRINWKYKAQNYPVGCELCQFGVECMDKNPMIRHDLDFD